MNPTALLSLLIPLALGYAIVPAGALGGAATRIAAAFLTGIALLTTLFTAAARLGAPLTLTCVGVISAALLALAGIVHIRYRQSQPTTPTHAPWRQLSTMARVTVALLVLLTAYRVCDAATRAITAPAIMTDAYENWLLKARTIHALQRVPSDPADPHYLGGGRVTYPLGMPMLATWTAIFNGSWDERAVGLIWPAYYAAIILLVGGVVGRHCGTLIGAASAYCVSSIPLVRVHACCAGYADLPLAAHLAALCVALWVYCDRGDRRALLIGALNGMFCILLKREGIILFAAVTVATLPAAWRFLRSRAHHQRAAIIAFVACAVAGTALYFTTGRPFLADEAAQISWRPEALRAIRLRLFTWDTWGLLWWLLLPLLVIGPIKLMFGQSRPREQIAAVCQSAALIGFVMFVFVLTSNAQFAMNGMTFDRSMLQLTPALAMSAAVSCRALCAPDSRA